MGKKLKITKEQLEEVVKISKNIVDLTNKVREIYGRGSYKGIYFILKRYKIDISNFESVSERLKGRKFKRSLEETKNKYLIKNSETSRCTIRKFILNNNLIEYKCQYCGCSDEWMNQKMPLILDHINGIGNDHRLENLRFLCSNCNSIQPTFCGRNIKNGE
jgi:hypothetical protein